jgi:hypothetical protein
VDGFFSKAHGPEVLQNRSYPGQWSNFARILTATIHPMSYTSDGLTEEGERQLRRVQVARPSPHRGSIRQPIRVLQRGHCPLPRAVLYKTPQQRLATRQQAVMRVRKREQRKKSEGRPAIGAASAMDPNPVVMLVVCLLAAAPMTDNRISSTDWTPAYDVLVAVFRPVGIKPVWRDGNWDKEDRSLKGTPPQR